MKKDEYIAKFGQEAYEKQLERSRKYRHTEKGRAKQREFTKKDSLTRNANITA